MTAPLFYVDEVATRATMTIRGEEAKHASAAMRIAPGEPVLVGDGKGTVARCTVTSADRTQIVVRIDDVDEVLAAWDGRWTHPVVGPQVVFREDCTIWVPDGWRGEPGPLGSLVVTRVAAGVGA